MVDKPFEDTWLTSLVDFCEIASRHVLAKAKMIGFVGVRRNSIGQIAKAVKPSLTKRGIAENEEQDARVQSIIYIKVFGLFEKLLTL